MDELLCATLRALSEPGALIEVVDFHEFGLELPLCNIVGAHWYDVPVDYADVLDWVDADYIACIDHPREWKTQYQITVGGMLALADADGAS